MFITQYVPIWMTQNESAFTNQGLASIETLKQYVDDQVLLGAPQTYAVPFTMNSQGIPLFAQPTQGILSFVTGGCSGGFTGTDPSVIPAAGTQGSCSFQHLGFWTGSTPANSTSTSGSLQTTKTYARQPLSLTTVSNRLLLSLPNRYFPGEKLSFANNAVLGTQVSSTPWFVVAPPLNITHIANNWTVSTSFVTLTGAASSYASQGTKAVYATLASNTTYLSAGHFINTTSVYNTSTTPAKLVSTSVSQARFNTTFTIGTANVCAWYNFLNNTTRSASLTLNPSSPPSWPGAWASLTVNASTTFPHPFATCLNSAQTTYVVQLTLYNFNFARVYSGVEGISFTVGGL